MLAQSRGTVNTCPFPMQLVQLTYQLCRQAEEESRPLLLYLGIAKNSVLCSITVWRWQLEILQLLFLSVSQAELSAPGAISVGHVTSVARSSL
jgi:hypothetical protein